MRRIELLSENIVTRPSPSAFGEKFQFQKLTEKFFETNHLKIVWNCLGESQFHILRWPSYKLSRKSVCEGGFKLPKRILRLLLYLKQKFSLTEPVRETRCSLIKFRLSPSKPLHPLKNYFCRFYKKIFSKSISEKFFHKSSSKIFFVISSNCS